MTERTGDRRSASEIPLFLGIDIGSVSLNVVVLDGAGRILRSVYERTNGRPLACLRDVLARLAPDLPEAAPCGTGSGRALLGDLLGLPVENEIVAHAWGAAHFHPEARTIIEIGGQDSKLILLDGRAGDGRPLIADQAMNEICAAGTGSFLDQQAGRLGVDIDGEFGDLACRSEHPATVAGRCSVFAKSDMIHLQQEGFPKEDVLAGLCYALARNYLSNLARGRKLRPPFLFQGGVAANRGVVRAFEDILGLGPGQLTIPEHFKVMGAIGAALIAGDAGHEPVGLGGLVERIDDYLWQPHASRSPLPKLQRSQAVAPRAPSPARCERLFLGIDVGSVSTNIVLIDDGGAVHNELYLYTEGDPVGVVRHGLGALATAYGQPPEVAAAGVTGSGRHLIGDFVGADTVVNEITAQARAAAAMDPEVDTVLEIGGQDSKFIRLRDGAVVDFEMNKVCAAGTGAFLAEQAGRLDIRIEEEFGQVALEADAPVDLGARCTVFMESDLIHHQQQGASQADLVAGLAYAVARNYLEKVVGHRPIGQRVLFQGGVAANPAVVAAFESLLGRPIIVPGHHRATGAIGAALLASSQQSAVSGQRSAFRGFDLSDRSYATESFQCTACPNRCDIKKVVLDGEASSFYGSICGKFDVRDAPLTEPDLFAEREAMLLDGWLPEGPAPGASTIGIPRVLLFHELFPEWAAYFQSLGYRVVLSDPTNRHIIRQGMEHVVVETCFPVKVAYGHVLDLVDKGVDRVFLPAMVEIPRPDGEHKSYICPYVQNVAAFIRSAFPDLDILRPAITSAGRKSNWRKAMARLGRELGHAGAAVNGALAAARAAGLRFGQHCRERGLEILAGLPGDVTPVVILGRPYNANDRALSLQLSRKLRQRNALPIPIDLLPLNDVPLDDTWDDVVWKSGRDFIAAAHLIRANPRLHPILVTSFGCGPDGFLVSILEELFEGRPFLTLELDEHFADAGAITRCEAFLHECRQWQPQPLPDAPAARPADWGQRGPSILPGRPRFSRTVYASNASEHYFALRAAFHSVGVPFELLPPPDRATEQLGRRATMSRGCIPLIFFAGDALRMPEMPDFRPERSAFFIGANDEACKVSQFPRSIRRILDREGLGDVMLLAPRVSMEAADPFHVLGPVFERNFFNALVAVDLLSFKAFETRPFEAEPGATDATFAHHAEAVADAVGTRRFLDAIVEALDALDAVPTDRSTPRPVIGLTGEHYVLSTPYANNHLFHHIEALGGQVWPTPYFTDYLRVQAWRYPTLLRRKGHLLAAAVAFIRGIVGRRDYARLERLFDGRIANSPEPSIACLFGLAAPYLPAEVELPVTSQVAKAIDFIQKGAAGIVHVLPLGCMMSTAAAGVHPRIRADHGDTPILTLHFDGLQVTNQLTRLQAFMHQIHARAVAAGHPRTTPSPPIPSLTTP